jgi:hypothetical protein
MNVRIHHAVSDIDGKTGMAIIGAIVEGQRDPQVLAAFRDNRCRKSREQIVEHLTGTWRDEHLFNLTQGYRTLLFIDERIAEYDEKVAFMFKTLANASGNEPLLPPSGGGKPSKKERQNASEKRVLHQLARFDITTIPGVGYDTAAILIAEIGTDFSRFPSEKHFAAYVGLAPSLGKSAGKNVRQRRRCGNTSRVGRALRMAASTLYKSQTELGAFFRSVARRTDRKTAVKATARRIAHRIYRAMRYGASYIDRGAEAFEARTRDRALRTVRKLIKTHQINELELKTVTTTV